MGASHEVRVHSPDGLQEETQFVSPCSSSVTAEARP